MMFCVDTVVSLIAVPVLIVLLGFVLFLLIAKRNKTDTLARLTYDLQNLIKLCATPSPDLKTIKKMDIAAGKCELLCDRASYEQKQDLGGSGEMISQARKVLHALCAAKVSGKDSRRYIGKAVNELQQAYGFLINTLGITAAPPSSSLKFFSKNMRSENARQYLDSLADDAGKKEEE